MNSIDSGSDVLVQAAVSVEKKNQDLQKTTGQMMIRLLEASGPQALPLAAAGEPGANVNVVA